MAVLAPVLERKLNTENNVATEESRNLQQMTAEERHNSRIKVNYARLINPDTTVGDIIYKEPAQPRYAEPVQTKFAEPAAREQKPFLVENARADADIFRADSRVNRRQAETESAQSEEEENEDLRPTATTIQYKSDARSKVVVEDKISSKQSKVSKLTKRDKIIMAVAALVVIALFVLVIINSAVLSNLNSEVSYLKYDLNAAQSNYTEVLQNKEEYLSDIEQTVADFAKVNGMTKTNG